jgi:hypothetical protein
MPGEQLRRMRDEIGYTHVAIRRGRDIVGIPLLGRVPVGSGAEALLRHKIK